jgi:hypothetical protein
MRLLSALALAALLACASGCRKWELHKVEGVITQGGKPVFGGGVTFKPVGEDSDLIISAMVLPSGKYTLMTRRRSGKFLGPGAPAGKYTVHYTPLGKGDGKMGETVRVPMIAEVKPGDNNIPIAVPMAEAPKP